MKKNKTLDLVLTYGNNTEDHLSQIIAGFTMLKRQQFINLNILFDPNLKNSQIHNAVIKLEVNDKTIIYDLADGYQSFHDMQKFDSLLNDIDFYFKRSFDAEKHCNLVNKNKIKPLGLNYHVSCPGNHYDFLKPKSINIVARLKEIYNYMRYEKRFHSKIYYPKFENEPSKKNNDYKILYSVRLYDPAKLNKRDIEKGYPELSSLEIDEVYENWYRILARVTQQRIEIVKVLKQRFGDKFIGGISEDDYALKVVPELIAPKSMTMKYEFMKLLKTNIICVSSEGLHHSIGWKFAEFVSASKAIVTDRLAYSLPGNFQKDKNYLEYTNTDELIKQLETLLNNTDLIKNMEVENYIYYKNYVKPDRLVFNSLKEANIL